MCFSVRDTSIFKKKESPVPPAGELGFLGALPTGELRPSDY